jgi:hypothetical protein
MRFVPPRGGFFLTLGIARDEDEAALGLLRDQHVLVHLGWFYDIDPEHLVITFVHDPARLAARLARMRTFLV